MPSLRERGPDILLLASHFLERQQRESGFLYTLSDDVLRRLGEYDWPENVRELENTIADACAHSDGPVLRLHDLPTQLQEFRTRSHPTRGLRSAGEASVDTRILTIAEIEKQAILNTLHRLDGDKVTAARLLGIGRTTLYRKLNEYRIQKFVQENDRIEFLKAAKNDFKY